MSRQFNIDLFLEKSNKIHNNKYDYSLMDYQSCMVKIKIICPTHGVFEQRASHHIVGSGCKHCRTDKMRKILTVGQDQVIIKAGKIHNNKYDYSKTNYTNSHRKIKIICPIHGVFEQRASHHLNGRGCGKCGTDKVANIRRLTTRQFIERSNKIHSNKYDYSQVEYIGTHVKVKIICPIHGGFAQTPANHLIGRGCSKCTKYGYNPDLPCALYLLKSADNKYLKIGISNNFGQRVDQLKRYTPFEFSVLKVFNIPGESGRVMERFLHSLGG